MSTFSMLSNKHWLEVIQRAPLISIDLIIRDPQDRILLGLRINEPARNTWFVPGGVIRKDETLDQAFTRIAQAELGLLLDRGQARLLGVYEHFYGENFACEPQVSTHYVVLPHALTLPSLPIRGPLKQHRELKAFDVAELLADPRVHENTKAYFC